MQKPQYQITIDRVLEGEPFDDRDEAIKSATHERPKRRWIEVRSSDGFQIFSEHEFEHADHLTAASNLIELLRGSDSTMPGPEVLDHIRQTVSLTKTTLLSLPGSGGYAGLEVAEYQLIARPAKPGCNKHVFVITAGYCEGYLAELYETRRDALEALISKIGAESIPLSLLFERG